MLTSASPRPEASDMGPVAKTIQGGLRLCAALSLAEDDFDAELARPGDRRADDPDGRLRAAKTIAAVFHNATRAAAAAIADPLFPNPALAAAPARKSFEESFRPFTNRSPNPGRLCGPEILAFVRANLRVRALGDPREPAGPDRSIADCCEILRDAFLRCADEAFSATVTGEKDESV